MPFDYETKLRSKMDKSKKLKIGIVGFGNYGQFLAARFVQQGHTVLAHSRTPYLAEAAALGVSFFADVHDFCEQHPEVVILASSIISTETVLKSLPVQRLKRDTLFVDVLSVKEFPKRMMLTQLPQSVDILCTHPMFGPDSGAGAWTGLNFMYDAVRVGPTPTRQHRLEAFLDVWRSEGCRMVEMTCEEHDRQAASTQFITHTVGRVLGAMGLQSTSINTRGFDSLLSLVDNTKNDSFDLYYGLFMYNQNSTEEMERLEVAFDTVRRQLFAKLHGELHDQMFPDISDIPHNSSMCGSIDSEGEVVNPEVLPPSPRGPLALLGRNPSNKQ